MCFEARRGIRVGRAGSQTRGVGDDAYTRNARRKSFRRKRFFAWIDRPDPPRDRANRRARPSVTPKEKDPVGFGADADFPGPDRGTSAIGAFVTTGAIAGSRPGGETGSMPRAETVRLSAWETYEVEDGAVLVHGGGNGGGASVRILQVQQRRTAPNRFEDLGGAVRRGDHRGGLAGVLRSGKHVEWVAWGGSVRREGRSGTRAARRGEAPGGDVSGKSARVRQRTRVRESVATLRLDATRDAGLAGTDGPRSTRSRCDGPWRCLDRGS